MQSVQAMVGGHFQSMDNFIISENISRVKRQKCWERAWTLETYFHTMLEIQCSPLQEKDWYENGLLRTCMIWSDRGGIRQLQKLHLGPLSTAASLGLMRQ